MKAISRYDAQHALPVLLPFLVAPDPKLIRTAASVLARYEGTESELVCRAVLNQLEGGPTGKLHLTFLFRGDEPFELTVETPGRMTATVVPAPGRRGEHARMLNRWWNSYQQTLTNQTR